MCLRLVATLYEPLASGKQGQQDAFKKPQKRKWKENGKWQSLAAAKEISIGHYSEIFTVEEEERAERKASPLSSEDRASMMLTG